MFSVQAAKCESPGSLSTSSLVLNRAYLAVHVVTVRRALVLLYQERAEVIDSDNGYANYNFQSWMEVSQQRLQQGLPQPDEHDDWIRTVRSAIQAPRIIRLTQFDRLPRRTLRFNRRNLLARDHHRCQYCGRALPHSQLSIDHVVPRSRGGETSWANAVCACMECNTHKGDRTPQEARMRLLRTPAAPQHNPWLAVKLRNPRYASWRTFLPHLAEAKS
jgi:5-methylcytosine-specific restriction endonuclease McrA